MRSGTTNTAARGRCGSTDFTPPTISTDGPAKRWMRGGGGGPTTWKVASGTEATTDGQTSSQKYSTPSMLAGQSMEPRNITVRSLRAGAPAPALNPATSTPVGTTVIGAPAVMARMSVSSCEDTATM